MKRLFNIMKGDQVNPLYSISLTGMIVPNPFVVYLRPQDMENLPFRRQEYLLAEEDQSTLAAKREFPSWGR
jgi:hypothetical protein